MFNRCGTTALDPALRSEEPGARRKKAECCSAIQLVCCERMGALAPFDNQTDRHLGQQIGNLSLGTCCSRRH